MYYKHQLEEIRNLDLEQKSMLKTAIETAKSSGDKTIQERGEAYEENFPTTYNKTKYSFTIAELLTALEVSTVDVILAEIKAADRKIDTVAEAFLRNMTAKRIIPLSRREKAPSGKQ